MLPRLLLAGLATAALTFSGLWLVAVEREKAAVLATPQHAVKLLRQARIVQPDTGPDLARAQRLAPADAARVLRGIVRSEPENAFAWQLLSVALAESDPEASARALERAAALTRRD